jgi:DUF1009 family protein
VLGLIAGAGSFPLDILHNARNRGYDVVAIAFHELTDPAIGIDAAVTWLRPGEVSTAVAALECAGVREAVMAGKVPKNFLFSRAERLGLDATAREILGHRAEPGDEALLCAVADHLESRGIRLLPQRQFAPELLAPEGPLGRVRPSPAQAADLDFGWSIARGIAALDVGQTVVVKAGSVLAVEAIEGTDAAIERAGRIAPGSCVVKVAKPGQDPRFDLPTIGPGTVRALVRARAAALGFEADQTVVLDRAAVVTEADLHAIPVVGMAGPTVGAGR